MKLNVQVLHNVSRDMFFRYNPRTSSLHHAHTFEIEADDTKHAADLLWTLTNVDDADHLRMAFPHLSRYAEQVTAYRQRQNRSLSVSDVLVFSEPTPGWVGPDTERPAGVCVVAGVGFDWLEAVPSYEAGDNDTPVSKAREAHRRFYEEENAR